MSLKVTVPMLRALGYEGLDRSTAPKNKFASSLMQAIFTKIINQAYLHPKKAVQGKLVCALPLINCNKQQK